MANFIYGKAKESLFKGQINISTNPLKALLIDSSEYTVSGDVHEFVSDIPSAAIKKRSDSLQGVTVTLGVIDAADVSIEDYDGSAFDTIVIYEDLGNDSTSRLIAYIDTSVGIPFSGSNSSIPVTIIWDNGPNKIIAL